MKSKRSKWCDISPRTRREVLVRDGARCINCGSTSYITLAHIFVNRSHGGKGSRDNLVCLCRNCHYYLLDNPIGEKQNMESKTIMNKCKNYLVKTEHITNVDVLIDRLKYKKGL